MKSTISIALILLVAGCEEPRAIVPQTSSAATDQTQTAVEPLAPATPSESTTEPIGQADEISGKVVGIIDGDTIDILTDDKTTTRIRLNGIDAPETGQPFGKNAKQFLSEKIGGKVVTVVPHDHDRYGRTIGDVYSGSTLINVEVVRAGLAWHYVQYAPDNATLAAAEREAKDAKLGLWNDARYVSPWEWRKLSKEERDKLR